MRTALPTDAARLVGLERTMEHNGETCQVVVASKAGVEIVATSLGRKQIEKYYLPSLGNDGLAAESLGGLVFSLTVGDRGTYISMTRTPCCLAKLRADMGENPFKELWLSCRNCGAYVVPERYTPWIRLNDEQGAVAGLAKIFTDFQDPLDATLSALALIEFFQEVTDAVQISTKPRQDI